MSNSFQFDSISMSTFIPFTFNKNDNLSGEQGGGMKRQYFFLGSGRRSYLVRIFLLEVCD